MPTPTKVPGLPAVPSNLESDLKAYLEALGEALEIRLGRRGDDLDRAVTLRELTEAGLVTTIKAQPFDPNRDITKDTVGVSPIGGLVVTVPPPPSNFVASGAFKNVVLTWTDPRFLYGNHAHTEVFRQDAQAADPDGIALNQTLSGSGNLTLNGILMTQDATNGTSINSSVEFNVPTTITITSAGNDSGRTFTVTGTNTSDGAQTEDITGANAGTATGSSIFKTVTQIAINGASAGNVSAGPAQSVDSIGSATQILIANAMTITDSSVQAGKAYFYWVRFINTSGIGGPFNSTNGTIASTVRIQEADISEDAITTPKLKAGSITADQAQLATASVVTASIADANITTAKINDAAITTAKINDAAITTAKITDANITSAKINDAAITTAKINTAAVTTLTIAGQAVIIPATAGPSAAYSSTTIITSSSPTTIGTVTISPSVSCTVIMTVFVQPLVLGPIYAESGGRTIVVTMQVGSSTKSFSWSNVLATNVESSTAQVVPDGLPFVAITAIFTGVSSGSTVCKATYYGTRGFKNGTITVLGAQR
tara:strand:+ start:2226 stop:3854 length:1629 start_codon:yes stop_codon:yes gene_type:complete